MPETPPMTLNIPVPDPSTITRVVIDREIANLRELIEERLSGMDKAIELVAHQAAQIPSAAQIDIENLRELTNEKFAGLNHRFSEREKRNERQDTEYKENVKTAFDAADKAITKTESVVAKTEVFLIKQIDLLFLQSQSSANRIQALESIKAGAEKQDRQTSRQHIADWGDRGCHCHHGGSSRLEPYNSAYCPGHLSPTTGSPSAWAVRRQ